MPIIAAGTNAVIPVTQDGIITILVQNGAQARFENPVGTVVWEGGANSVFGPFAAAGNVKVTSVSRDIYYDVAALNDRSRPPLWNNSSGASLVKPNGNTVSVQDPANVAITGGSAAFTGPFSSRGITDNATATAVTISASGQVGIGGAPTSARLHIQGGGANRIAFLGGTGTLYLGYDGANDALQVASNQYIAFQTGGTYAESARIFSSGRWGFNTTTDDGVNQLQVAGAGKFTGDVSAASKLIVGNVASDGVNTAQINGTLGIKSGSALKLYNPTNGGFASLALDASNIIQVSNNAVLAAGATVAGAAPVAAAGQIALGGTTATTVGATGAAAALPANPLGYMLVNVAGTVARIPYYN